MGFFDKFKSARDVAKEEIKEMQWIPLERMNQLDEIVETSKAVPVVIFKHSTTCGISRMALRGFEKNYDYDKKQLEPYFLDLKQYREISNAIAERFNVQHESPQLLLIKNGTVTYHTSHSGIDAGILSEKI
ncbi:MAG: cytosolic protein [Leeuwenhoekiella sp.]|nr:MAG: cytosolic protein [Leeuwenhoekiella sp.]